MQKMLKILILFVFLFAGVAVFVVRTQVVFSDEHKFTFGENNSARDLYQKNCARCHGSSGKSDTELGLLLDSPDLTDRNTKKMSQKKIARIINEGKGGMPAFKKKLSSKEIASLVNYVRSF